MIKVYHYSILFFNLLPIYPLDGGKLINLFFSTFLTFKLSFYMSIFVSISVLIILIILTPHYNLNFLFVIIFLLIKIIKEYRLLDYQYQKFLLERYLHPSLYKKTKLINNVNNFYRDKKHLVKIADNYMWEEDFLNKMYKKC